MRNKMRIKEKIKKENGRLNRERKKNEDEEKNTSRSQRKSEE